MDLDLAHFALDYAQKNGASYADVRLDSSAGNGFILKNGVPQLSGFDRVQGIGIRLGSNGSYGFASTNELEKEKIKSLIDSALRVTAASSRIGEKPGMSDEQTHTAEVEVPQKINLNDLPPKDKMEVLFDIEKEIAASKVNVPGRFFSLSDTFTEKYFISSDGAKIHSSIPEVEFWHFLTVESSGKTAQRYWHYGASGGFEKINEFNFPARMKEEVLKSDENLRKAIPAPKEKIDLVVGPQVTGIMVHESVGHPYEADRVMGREAAQAGETFITQDMLGSRIGSDAVTICDDPTMAGSFGYYLYDDDGVKAQNRVLIKKGMINEFLHNRATAHAMGTKSNGSARATGFDREAIVRMANTYVQPGTYTEEELIEGVKTGVFMKNFMEWNIDDKRLNAKYTGAEAYMIRDGKLAEPVSMPIIEISTPALWSSVDAVAKNMEYHAGTCGKAEPMQAIPVWFGGPSMRIRNIRLSH
jgi:TldD protein